MSARQQLNSTQRRVRKEQVARRSGWRCAYCRIPFARLAEVTLDHVVPVSLWRTWSAAHLVAACATCNHAKGDRLPLSFALLLISAYGRQQSSTSAHGPTCEHGHGGVHGQRPDASIGGQSVDSHAVDWRLLARLAHAQQPVFTATWAGPESADSIGARSMPDLYASPCHSGHDATLAHRADCLRSARLVRDCTRSTCEAVPA